MLTQVIAQDHRADLSAQDHRVYDQRQTESDGCDAEEEPEENGLEVSSATRGRASGTQVVHYLHEICKFVL